MPDRALNMSETRFTITLGRTGQVVKRGGNKQFSDGFLSVNKRRRMDEFKWSPGGKRFNDSRGTQYDLRLKLIQKRHAEKLRRRHLREKQLKPVQQQGNANMLMHEHQVRGSNLLRQYPSKEVLGDLHLGNSIQKYYLFQTKDGSTVRPPGRTLNSLGRPSVPGTLDGLRQVSRDSQVLSNAVVHASRPTTVATMKAAAQFAEPVAWIGHIMPKSPSMGVDTLTVSSLLHSLGLRKYTSRFQAEEVDMDALKQLSDKDLNNLGIPMGPRKKILRALQACTKRQLS